MKRITAILDECLCLPDEAMGYRISERLAHVFPEKHVLETTDGDFDIEKFARDGHCGVRASQLAHYQADVVWWDVSLGAHVSPRNGVLDVRWSGEHIRIVIARIECGVRWYVIARTETVARAFFAAVCRWTSHIAGEILVFAGGYWHTDPSLLKSIAESRLEHLVMPYSLKQHLVGDFEEFFEAEDLYSSLGIAWKRGLLLLGPPGNGKTHAVKAMVNRLGKPCLYVRSFASYRNTPQGCIEIAFQKARSVAPCILVLEDLDSLIDGKTRSYFLNQMDGFATNHGILTVATTNYPERLDPAILDRPSRFDRKITFSLPDQPERRTFLALANERCAEPMRLGAEDLDRIAMATEGFSFAYLKELCVSGAMSWMRERREGCMADSMLAQVEALLGQMKTEAKAPSPPAEEDEECDEFAGMRN